MAIVRDTSSRFLYLVGMSVCVVSPSRQRDGDDGILQPNMLVSVVLSVQKE